MDLKGKVTAIHKGWGMYPVMAEEEGTPASKARVCIDLDGGGRVELELGQAEAKAFPFGAQVKVALELVKSAAVERTPDGDE